MDKLLPENLTKRQAELLDELDEEMESIVLTNAESFVRDYIDRIMSGELIRIISILADLENLIFERLIRLAFEMEETKSLVYPHLTKDGITIRFNVIKSHFALPSSLLGNMLKKLS